MYDTDSILTYVLLILHASTLRSQVRCPTRGSPIDARFRKPSRLHGVFIPRVRHTHDVKTTARFLHQFLYGPQIYCWKFRWIPRVKIDYIKEQYPPHGTKTKVVETDILYASESVVPAFTASLAPVMGVVRPRDWALFLCSPFLLLSFLLFSSSLARSMGSRHWHSPIEQAASRILNEIF